MPRDDVRCPMLVASDACGVRYLTDYRSRALHLQESIKQGPGQTYASRAVSMDQKHATRGPWILTPEEAVSRLVLCPYIRARG